MLFINAALSKNQLYKLKNQINKVPAIIKQDDIEYVHMRGEMNSYRFEISNGHKNKFCSRKFHFGCISKCPDILMNMCRHFISGGVYIIFYYPKWNFISVKMTNMKSIPALNFICTCALNATSNESALIHFVSGKLCSHEDLMPVWNFVSVKMTDMKSIPFWVSFHLNSCEHK